MSTFITPNHVGCMVRLRNEKITPIVSYKEDDIWCYKGLNGLAWRPDGGAGFKYDTPHPEDIVAFASLLKRPTQSDSVLRIYETEPTTKHTPGPWTLGNGEVRIRTEKNEQGRSILVAECYTTGNAGRYPKYEERKANARLIAAAPELLEALKGVMNSIDAYVALNENKPESEWDEYDYMMIPKWKFAKQVLAKAEGEAQ